MRNKEGVLAMVQDKGNDSSIHHLFQAYYVVDQGDSYRDYLAFQTGE
jgi:hypothetical protein